MTGAMDLANASCPFGVGWKGACESKLDGHRPSKSKPVRPGVGGAPLVAVESMRKISDGDIGLSRLSTVEMIRLSSLCNSDDRYSVCDG